MRNELCDPYTGYTGKDGGQVAVPASVCLKSLH